MTDHVKHAGKLRSRRKADITFSESNGDRQDTIEVNISSTIACVILLLCIGASVTVAYIMIHNPNCLGGGSAPTWAPSTGSIRRPPSLANISRATKSPPPTPPPVPPPPPAPPAPPVPICTVEQESQIEKQLPSEGCFAAPFPQECSFTVATRHGGCQDNTVYYREPIAQLSLNADEIFTAVLLGLTDKDDTPMDLLRIGSHDKEKYSVQAWREAAAITGCSKPEIAMGVTNQKAQVLVVETDATKASIAKRLKATIGLTDAELRGEPTIIASTKDAGYTKTLNEWAQTAVHTGDIHFLRINIAHGQDADILSSGGGNGGVLERVWYLEFVYNWKDGWESATLKPLIDDTLNRFACYWYGTNGNLWRITGCWLDFYAQKHWSSIVCVNVGIEGAKPIYDKMEQVFQETLEKDLVMKKAT